MDFVMLAGTRGVWASRVYNTSPVLKSITMAARAVIDGSAYTVDENMAEISITKGSINKVILFMAPNHSSEVSIIFDQY